MWWNLFFISNLKGNIGSPGFPGEPGEKGQKGTMGIKSSQLVFYQDLLYFVGSWGVSAVNVHLQKQKKVHAEISEPSSLNTHWWWK